MQPFHIQLIDLIMIQLANWRWSWRSTLVTGMVAPIFSTLALGIFAADSGKDAVGYVLTGNMVLALLFETVGKVSSNLSFMRMTGMLDYMATLPIYRVSLIVATMFAFLMLSLPAVIVTVLVGAVLLDVTFQFSPLVIVVIPIISLTLCGLGAMIGIIGRTPEEVNSLSLISTLVLMGMGPVIIPAERLPEIVRVIGLFSPATYAASALRQVILGTSEPIPLGVDLAVLLAIALGLLWLVGQRMDWRRSG